MNPAWISLGALVVAIAASCTTSINVGVLSIAFAWLIGVYVAGLSVADIAAGFPTQLFLTLVGVTMLFAQAQVNGTLAKLADRGVRACRGNVGLIPIMFFGLGLGLASIGPGNIASTALLAPMAMAVAGRVGIPAFLMAIMVANGANAGSLSPLAPTGIIVSGTMAKVGLPGHEWFNYLNNLAAHVAVAFGGYFLLGGLQLIRRTARSEVDADEVLGATGALGEASDPFEPRHLVTLATIVTLVTGVIFFGINVGLGAFAGAGLLTLLRVANEAEAMRRMPWPVILMVTGVTVLVALLEKTGGLDLFTALLARVSTRETVTAVMGFTTGLISIYSSTSGVVLPALLPTVPGLAERLGGADPLAIASSMNVGGHLVDVSPLSTLGALCLAAAPPGEDTRALFNKLMAWGLSMAAVGAGVCYLLFGWR
jgi:Na+/H+ antiporter NhaD/arsenite permease-like protein